MPWDAPVVRWGGCRGGPGSPMAFEGLGGLGSSRCQGWELHSWHWLLHAADARNEGRQFPIPCDVETGWVPAPACPRRMQGVLGLAAAGTELRKA